MSQKYALPCTCGSAVPVEIRHAGGTQTCPKCSTTLDVPKLRDIRKLEPIVNDAAATTRSNGVWSGLQGLLFVVGLLCLAIATGSAGYTFANRRQYDDSVQKPSASDIRFERDINEIALVDSWQLWKNSKDVRLASRPKPRYLQARELVARMDGWLKFFGLLATFGLACVGLSFLLRPQSASNR